MARTETIAMALGFDAPEFTLYEPLTRQHRSLKDIKSDKVTMVAFVCNHCPYVKHIFDKLVELGDRYIPQGASFIIINSNDVEKYPEDSPKNMVEEVIARGISFPYLYDATQEVAKAYNAACTPEFNLFDADMKCVYRGQFDSSRPGNDTPVTGKDLATAIEQLLMGKEVPTDQVPSIGCGIKWKTK